MKILTTTLLLSIAMLESQAMDDRAPLQLSGTGMQLKRSVVLALKVLKQRASEGDENAKKALALGETQTAVEAYNQSLMAQRYQTQSGSPGGSYAPPPSYENMTREKMAQLLEESDNTINARIVAIETKYYNGENVTPDEEAELEFLRKQLDLSLPDRISYEEHKAKIQADALKAKLGAEARDARDKVKSEAEKKKRAELLAQYKVTYQQVRANFTSLSLEQQEALKNYYRESTLWKILYLSVDENDFSQDSPLSGQYYERQITGQIGLREMNQDELQALVYALDKMPTKMKREVLLNQINLRLVSGTVTPQSSLEVGLAKSKMGSSPRSDSPPPPPPPSDDAGMPPPPPPPSSSQGKTGGQKTYERPKFSDEDLKAQMDEMRRRAEERRKQQEAKKNSTQ
ncbi:MAG: hypothetical protein KF820_04125 [Candidatus Paracaedibacteraceae bacterium]|nr:hypothetical protein [Candidatus Paracaedibacteraceae bacterium]